MVNLFERLLFYCPMDIKAMKLVNGTVLLDGGMFASISKGHHVGKNRDIGELRCLQLKQTCIFLSTFPDISAT